jgi:hypothetical protein
MTYGERWAMSFSANLRTAFANWAKRTGGTVDVFAQGIGESKYTAANWLSPTNPTIPRADKAIRAARFLGVSVDSLEDESPVFVAKPEDSIPATPYGDIIKMLNDLSEKRLDDVRHLIGPWANENRGAAQNAIDIIADLKVLTPQQLEDLRVLVRRWSEEVRNTSMTTERAEEA